VLGDAHTADDVFQRVMIQAWRNGAAFDAARGSLLTWLMTIARSRALDELRRRVPEPVDPASATTLHEAHATHEDPGERIAGQWRLRHLLGQLPAAEARLLRMRFELGLSQSEIALATGIALGTVKMRMSRALQRLRDLIEEYE
jgi:RNA polymerase sigma-70 factor, ECF subfamily